MVKPLPFAHVFIQIVSSAFQTVFHMHACWLFLALFSCSHAYIAAAGLEKELEIRTQNMQQQIQQQQIQRPEQAQQQLTEGRPRKRYQEPQQAHPKVEKAQNELKAMPIPTIQSQQRQIPSTYYSGKTQGHHSWEGIEQQNRTPHHGSNTRYNSRADNYYGYYDQPRNYSYRQSNRASFYMNRKVDHRTRLDNRNKHSRRHDRQ